ncbi:cell wall protein AWA1-like isoform X4 [Tachysurus fulvidraco]|uniref:cell wall protein AWA1-like isoform X4 n=1 Tax=Tachysurus fulvidraco TaxID=1234273 RepID=UPI001FF075D0|nr:cell wall protein AWA1-like isoform X4 [Tachysurus fulvidraco]
MFHHVSSDMMESRLMVLLLLCSVAHVTEAQLLSVTTTNSFINTTSCGTTKLCVFSSPNCNLTGTSNCFFSSTKYNNSILTVEMSGTTSGYVALALTPATNPLIVLGTVGFVCGNNDSGPFFETVSQNGVVLTPANMATLNITNVQALVTSSQSVIQCTFNVAFLNISIPANVQLPSNLAILTGTSTGTTLGSATTVFSSSGTLDLANPASNVLGTITSVGCGTTKLCVFSTANCNLTGTSNCFFSSTKYNNNILTVEMSGTTSGYVALALTPATNPLIVLGTVVFVCGNNNSNLFFGTASQAGVVLTPANMATLNITNVQALVTSSQSVIQCTFNVAFLNISIPANVQLPSNLAILTGTSTGTTLGSATTVFSSSGTLDLANPASNVLGTITSVGCGTTKLCVFSTANCNLTGTSSCFFSSTKFNNNILTVEMSGTTSGYVALALTPATSPLNWLGTVVFVCGNNNSNLFFGTASQAGVVLTPVNMPILNITNIQALVTSSQSVVQCTFTVTINTIIPANIQLPSNLAILNGTSTGTTLGNATTVFSSSGTLDLTNPASNVLGTITSVGCGTTKLCVFSTANCSLTGSSSCFFSSTKFNNSILTVEMSGTTSGYVALALTPATSPLNVLGTVVFFCGNNNANLFFGTASQNGTVLTPASMTALNITNVQASVTSSQSVIQCAFNVAFLNISIPANVQLPSNLAILTGTSTGTTLGSATTVFSSKTTLDLANPASNLQGMNITSVGCGTTKLCVNNAANCNPAVNSSCFFASAQLINQNFTFQLSGPTTGYVALGLSQLGTSVVFVCGSNSSNFLFTPATLVGTALLPVNLNTVYSVQGAVSQNLVQCIFNTSSILNITGLKSTNTSFRIAIMNGSINGNQLGPANVVFDSLQAVNLNSSPTITAHVLAVLFSALTLCLLY